MVPTPGTDASAPVDRTSVRVAIVGSGFSGLAVAVRLKQAGIHDFVVLERGADVGGTWRDNTYPGATCDVPSHLYSFSFAPNPDWTHSFSPQSEILDYLRGVARDFALLPHCRFGHEVRAARWLPRRARWLVKTNRGTLTARVLVLAVGALSDPKLPEIPGLRGFLGRVFHSAAWEHDYDLSGKRVAVIGTGASAIQFVPQIQPRVERLHLFQRTAPWVIPRQDRVFGPLEKWLYRHVPGVQRLARTAIYLGREAYLLGFTVEPKLMKGVEALARYHLRTQILDPRLRAKLTPNFTIGCKRILIANDYYPTLTQPNVELITDGIREFRRDTVVTVDGTERALDAVICATGFHVTDVSFVHHVFDGEGRSLAAHWATTGMTAYRGTTVTGFPNLFTMVGPNTGLGHSSMVLMIEAQARYVVDALHTMAARGLEMVEVRPEVQERFNQQVQRRMQGTVWLAGGCASWYLDREGRSTVLWPRSTWAFRRLTRRFDRDAYVATARGETQAPGSRERPVSPQLLALRAKLSRRERRPPAPRTSSARR
jgi:cation diffusion facilitator CzcD-associated flavoprotein CzcO